MYHHDVLHSTFVRDLKRTLIDLELFAIKRTRSSSDQLSTSSYSTQNEHSEKFNSLCDSSNWRKRLKSSLLKSLDKHYSSIIKQLTINSQLSVWLDAVSYSRVDFCSVNSRIFSSSSFSSRSNYIELKRSQSCEARFNLVRHKQSVRSSNSKSKRFRLTLTTLQKMSQQESQYAESLVSRFNFSSNKAFDISDAAYINTLYDHDIVMNLSERKISEELTSLKERILQRRFSSQLNDQAVFAIMNVAKKLTYNSEDSTNKILRTLMFSLEYDDLIESENTQWNTVAMSNNSQCDNKLSTLKLDVYLIYSRDSKSSWTVTQNNVVNHSKVRSYSQSTNRNTFSSLSLKLKTEFADEVLITAKTQTANSESHFVNSILWLLEKVKTTELTEVDLMQNTVSFSIVSSHRQIVVYLHWLHFKKKHFYMSYLRSYSTFETDDIRECNNTIKNIIDNANESRKIKIEKVLVTLELIKDSWNSRSTVIHSSTLNIFFSEESMSRKRRRDS